MKRDMDKTTRVFNHEIKLHEINQNNMNNPVIIDYLYSRSYPSPVEEYPFKIPLLTSKKYFNNNRISRIRNRRMPAHHDTKKQLVDIFNRSLDLITIDRITNAGLFHAGRGCICDREKRCLLLVSLLVNNLNPGTINEHAFFYSDMDIFDHVLVEIHPLSRDKAWLRAHPGERFLLDMFEKEIALVREQSGKEIRIILNEEIQFLSRLVIPRLDAENQAGYNKKILSLIKTF